MNIILSDVSRYNGSKGTWKDVFKYYVSNPSFRVIFLHRLYNQWYHILSKIPMGKGIFSLYYKHICRQSGIQLSLGAEIGEGFKFEHFGGIVIGSIKIGKNCNIFHNVTIGYAGRWQNGGGSPTIGDNVVIGAGAVVVGRITIGDSAFIGANAYVYQDIPENAVVGAMPGKILSYNGTKGYFGH